MLFKDVTICFSSGGACVRPSVRACVRASVRPCVCGGGGC